jgi:hypothetical protein
VFIEKRLTEYRGKQWIEEYMKTVSWLLLGKSEEKYKNNSVKTFQVTFEQGTSRLKVRSLAPSTNL